MKYSASWLLLATAAIGSLQAAPIDISGVICMDGQFPFQPSNLQNNVYVSRARMDFKGSWTPNWSYKVRIDCSGKPFSSDNTVATIPTAFVTWKVYDGKMKVNFGRDTPRYSQAGTEAQSYIERSLGVLEDSVGQRIGANISGIFNQYYGYSLGVWSATARSSVMDYAYSVIALEDDAESINPGNIDAVSGGGSPTVTFGTHSIRPAIGGRVNAVVMENSSFAWGSGLGVQSLDVIVPMVVTYNDGHDTYHNTFEKRIAFTVDQSFGWKKFTLNTAYHFFKYYRDTNASTDRSSIPEGVNAFQRHNQAASGYVELTRLIIGEGYKMDPATGVVNKVIPNAKYGSLELALRIGREYYYNAAAAQKLKKAFNSNPAVPMTFANETGYNLVTVANGTSDDIVARIMGYTLAASFVTNDHIAIKAEYYHTKTSSRNNQIWTTLEKEEGLRIRSEFQFG